MWKQFSVQFLSIHQLKKFTEWKSLFCLFYRRLHKTAEGWQFIAVFEIRSQYLSSWPDSNSILLGTIQSPYRARSEMRESTIAQFAISTATHRLSWSGTGCVVKILVENRNWTTQYTYIIITKVSTEFSVHRAPDTRVTAVIPPNVSCYGTP